MGKTIGDRFPGLFSLTPDIERAKKGDYHTARYLVSLASKTLLKGESLPNDLAIWIGKGLNELISSGDTKKSFNLNKSRGAPPKYSEEFQRLVAESIHYSNTGRYKGSNCQGTSLGAYAKAQKDFGISENKAEEFYHKFAQSIEQEEQLRAEFEEEN